MTTSQPPDEIVDASGPGSHLMAGPISFYLTHQVKIDEWAKLKAATEKALDRWYREVVLVRFADVEGWEYLGETASRSSAFGRRGQTDRMEVGLSWDSGWLEPYVFVWVESAALATGLIHAAGSALERFTTSEANLVAWRTIPLETIGDPWWGDLDQARQVLVTAVKDALQDLASPADVALSSVTSSAALDGGR